MGQAVREKAQQLSPGHSVLVMLRLTEGLTMTKLYIWECRQCTVGNLKVSSVLLT